MADMISKCCPSDNPPLVEILRRPEKLLFVIDGFDELTFSLDQPQNYLSSDQLPCRSWNSVWCVNALLKILGFSAADRDEYFHKCFENKEERRKASQFVKGNEMVFTMCLVPIMCWIVCTVMKQQLESGEDLAQTANTTTGIYILYVSSLLTSLSSKLKQNLHIILKILCCLAADGIWKQRVLFEEEAINEFLLNQRDTLPLFLNESTFQEAIVCGSAYSFIHLSVQEFFASLFYGKTRDKQEDPKRDVKKLLENYGNSRHDFRLEWCELTAACCGVLATVLSTSQCLKELRLRGNALGDPGVQLLCEGLKHPTCWLQRLGSLGLAEPSSSGGCKVCVAAPTPDFGVANKQFFAALQVSCSCVAFCRACTTFPHD
ncbi:NACHT, LRR and PYD domains-containing protein 3-like [Calonectris borealis]|uniref:NACHT, LRR and PYD domains-containing protein 3-like n=1 Tax=Calonectris borealis TaxID=1323832 RepID=UPI003F4C5F16